MMYSIKRELTQIKQMVYYMGREVTKNVVLSWKGFNLNNCTNTL